mmetsp:Transcript_20123/g.14851  ORF Transcript_20123/g.14851 Transcript_20123/m.14851 type:complete len:129 (-) Transcript_20123:1095-1481(-)
MNRSVDSSGNQLSNLLAQKFKLNKSALNKSNLEEDKSNISIHDDGMEGTGDLGDSKFDSSGNQEMILNQLKGNKKGGKNHLSNYNSNTPSSAREQELNFLGLKEELNDQYKTARNKPRKTLKEQEEEE